MGRAAGLPAAALMLAALVMAGWWAGIPRLTTFLATAPEAHFNAALLGFLLALSVALTARLDGGSGRMRPFLASSMAAMVVIVALATLVEHVTGAGLGIDQLFFRDQTPAPGDPAPGRASVPTAAALALLGLVALARSRGAREGIVMRAMTLVPAGVALAVLFSYFYGVAYFFDPGSFAQPSLPMALIVLLLAAELLTTGDRSSAFTLVRYGTTRAARTVRVALAWAVVAALVIGLARLAAQRAGWVGLEQGLALHTTVVAVGVVALLLWLGGQLDASERRLDEINLVLESRIAERTRELEASALALASANRELEAFAYSVAHDLRTPLRSLDGISRILVEDCGPTLDSEHRDYLDRIRAAAQRMGVLIDALLRLSREARMEMSPERLDLGATAAKIVAELRAGDPGREVETTIAPGLAARGDAQLVEQLLRNLLENAWKFTAKTARPRIEIGSRDDDGETVFFVRDNGAGFDPAFAGKMFTAFQRLHRVDEFPGTGIGLTSVQRIARRHGGRVWAEGNPGEGATIYFTLEGEVRDAQKGSAG